MRRPILAAVLVLLPTAVFGVSPASGAAGDPGILASAPYLDPSFGSGGATTLASRTAVGAEVVGDEVAVVANKDSAGFLEFDTIVSWLDHSGKVVAESVPIGDGFNEPRAVAVDAQGRLLVEVVTMNAARQTGVEIIRFAGHTLDPTFGSGGIASLPSGDPTSTVYGPIVATEDGIVALSWGGGATLTRLLDSGDLDPSFGSGGVKQFVADHVDLEGPLVAGPNGTILLLTTMFNHSQYAVVRFTRDGDLDPTFSGDGIDEDLPAPNNAEVTLGRPTVDPTGRVFVSLEICCTATTKVDEGIIAAATPSGAPDSTFGTNGQVRLPVERPATLALDPAGDIVAGLFSNAFPGTEGVAHFSADGQPDRSFNPTGFTSGGSAVWFDSFGIGPVTVLPRVDGDTDILFFGNEEAVVVQMTPPPTISTGLVASAWHPEGGGLNTGPTVSSPDLDQLDAYVAGADGQVWHRYFAGGWSSWSPIGGFTTDAPATASPSPGVADVFVRGGDGQVWHRRYSNGWLPWEPVGGLAVGAPAAAATGDGGVAVFIRGVDNQLWRRILSAGGFGAWQPLGGVLTGPPAAASSGASTDVVVPGSDGALYARTLPSPRWVRLGGGLVGAPAVAAGSAGQLDLLLHGLDGQLWYAGRRGSTWSPFEALGGTVVASPAAVNDRNPRQATIEVMVRGSDGQLWDKELVSPL